MAASSRQLAENQQLAANNKEGAMTILFTPAGDTDPVRGFRDGAILHILRHYPQVEKVILFLTKEMEEKENKEKCNV